MDKMNAKKKVKCETPGCTNLVDPEDLHPCPYLEDICDDKDTLCNCCHECRHSCLTDI